MNQEKHTPALEKFYFTYGNSPDYPFQDGWTLIFAPNMKAAQQIFKAYHPNKEGWEGSLNCADFYTEAQFREQDFRDGNYGAFCHEVICPRLLETE